MDRLGICWGKVLAHNFRIDAHSVGDKLAVTLQWTSDISCPISQDRIKDPVIIVDGGIYCRESITQWFQQKETMGQPITSPLTGLELPSTSLMSVKALTQTIETYLSNRPEFHSAHAAGLVDKSSLPSNLVVWSWSLFYAVCALFVRLVAMLISLRDLGKASCAWIAATTKCLGDAMVDILAQTARSVQRRCLIVCQNLFLSSLAIARAWLSKVKATVKMAAACDNLSGKSRILALEQAIQDAEQIQVDADFLDYYRQKVIEFKQQEALQALLSASTLACDTLNGSTCPSSGDLSFCVSSAEDLGVDAEYVAQARVVLSKVRKEEALWTSKVEAKNNLQQAQRQSDIRILKNALEQAQSLGIEDSNLLESSQRALVLLEREKAAEDLLLSVSNAVSTGDAQPSAGNLSSQIEDAKRRGVTASDISHAREVLSETSRKETAWVANRALLALQNNRWQLSLSELQEKVSLAKCGAQTSHSRAVLSRAEKQIASLELDAAMTRHNASVLRPAIVKALECGVSDEKIEPALARYKSLLYTESCEIAEEALNQKVICPVKMFGVAAYLQQIVLAAQEMAIPKQEMTTTQRHQMGRMNRLLYRLWKRHERNLQPGFRVLLFGLESEPDLNGSQGELVQFYADQQRWKVQVSDATTSGSGLLIKPENLQPLQHLGTCAGDCVPESLCACSLLAPG